MTNFFFFYRDFFPFLSIEYMLFIYLYLHLYGNMITGFFHRRKFVRKGKKKYRMREISYNKLISRSLFFSFFVYIFI